MPRVSASASCFIGPCGMADPDRPPIAPRRRPRLSTSVALRPYPPLVVPGPHPRPRTRPPVLARRAGTRRGPRWLPRARRDAHERRILAPPRLPGSRATAPRPVSTPRPRRGYGAYAVRAPGERDGGALPSLSIYLYTLSRSRRSNMQPARDHLNSITVVCASPRRAAPLRLHRPHVARVYRTTGDHRTHYLIKSRSEPKRPPRG